MNLTQIESFLTLASTLSYTKASGILHTTQPNLSKMMMNIEQELNVKLLVRNRRDVKLTPAGVIFYEEMKKMLHMYELAKEKIKDAESGVRGEIKLGFLGTALMHLLPQIVNQFRQKYPHIKLRLFDYTYSRLMEALLTQAIDVALIPDYDVDKLPMLNKRFLLEDDMCVVVPKSSPYAELESIDLTLFKEAPFVVIDPSISIKDFELVKDICVKHNFLPRVAVEANTLNNLLMMIDCGTGVSILAKHMKHFATEGVNFINIKGYEKYFRVSCAWSSETNPCIPKLLEVIDKCIIPHVEEHSSCQK